MTKDECRVELNRLASAWSVTIQAPTTDAIFGRIGHIQPAEWKAAVDELLVNYLQAPRAGLLDHVLKAVETVKEHRHRLALTKDRIESERFLAGKIAPIKWADPREGAYNAFRFRLLLESRGHGFQILAQRHADGLREWMSKTEHEAWAVKTPQEVCGYHKATPHTLWACIVDEEAHWSLRVAGKTEPEAREALGLLTIEESKRLLAPQPEHARP